MAGETAQLGIFEHPFFTQVILPFLLIFTIVYAILERTEILGKAKRQINAIVALVIALIVVGVPAAIGVITKMIPIIAIFIVILLLFMLLFGFIGGVKAGEMGMGMKIAFGIILGIAMIVTVIWAIGGFDWFAQNLTGGSSGTFWQTVVFSGIIITAIAVAVSSGSKTPRSGE